MTPEIITPEMALAAQAMLSSDELTLADGVYAYNGLLDELQALSDRYVSRTLFINKHRQWIQENPSAPTLPLVKVMVTQAEKQQADDLAKEAPLLEKTGKLLWDLINTPEFHQCFEKGPVRFPGGLRLDGKPVDLHTLVPKPISQWAEQAG